MTWDRHNEATLRQLWADGLSASEIGKRMGCGKNAILGKAHRLVLPSRARPQMFEPGSDAAMAAVDKRKATVAARRAESIRQTVALKRAGHTPAEIAVTLGAHLDTVRAWLREVGENSPAGARPRKPRLPVERGPRVPREARESAPRKPRPPREPAAPRAPHAAMRYGVTGCRFPIGDPAKAGFRFCEAADIKDGSCYCHEHYLRAYTARPIGGAFVLPYLGRGARA